MNDWTAGYVADIGYTHGYYPELNPLRARLALLSAGLAPPSTAAASELGYGQGLSVNIHAAASSVRWHATDFNPSQANFARMLGAAGGTDVELHDDTFAEFAKRDLPEFDFIGLHGIWSWISDENRTIIVDFLRRKLRVGGVLYISYNTQPGWAAFAPLRQLMAQHAAVMGADGAGTVSKVDGALEFTEQLLATNPGYSRANPQVLERIKSLKAHNRQYLAHEYFNRDWHPMHFGTMAEWLAPAKLAFACSANYLDHIDTVNLTKDQQDFLRQIADPFFRESVRDFMVNQQFRRDYWVKGARRLGRFELAAALHQQKVVLLTHRPDVGLKISGSLGEVSLHEAVYTPVLDALADHKPRTLAELEQAIVASGGNVAQLLQIVMVLTGGGHLAAVQDDEQIARALSHTRALNSQLLLLARESGEIGFLASPVTGAGVPTGRFHQLCLLARSQGQTAPADWAQFAWQALSAQGQQLRKNGVVIESVEENVAELKNLAETFKAKHLPTLQALLIAD